MTLPQPTEQPSQRPAPRRRSHRRTRLQIAQAVDEFARPGHRSQRQYARAESVPRSCLAYQLRFDAPADLDPQLIAFLRSPSGHTFVRRVVAAAFSTFHSRAACGIRTIGEFLRLAHLDSFVATSYGALHTLATHLNDDLICLGAEEEKRLAPRMTPKAIALVPDENFHADKPCLIAIEPVSNFVLVETDRERRDADTWTKAIQERLQGLPVTPVLLTSDQAPGLIKCAEDGLEVLHLPELFHGQRSLLQPLLLPLQRPIQQAQKDLEKAKDAQQRFQAKQAAASLQRTLLTKAEFDYQYSLIQEERDAAKRLHQASARQEEVVEQVRGFGDDYHPFDRRSGRPVEADEMAGRLDKRLQKVTFVAKDARLSQQTHEALRKAQQWVVSLVAMVAWYWTLVKDLVGALELNAAAEQLVYNRLLPGLYWQAAARRARTGEERERLQELSERLVQEAWAPGGALAALAQDQRKEVERVARECAGLFCRSSSCVEGRNGRLALHHHGQGKLSQKRLKALTVVHNYLIQRPDGTTAAERFFGTKPRNLFECLLERMPDLPKPAAKRPNAKRRKKPPQTTAKTG